MAETSTLVLRRPLPAGLVARNGYNILERQGFWCGDNQPDGEDGDKYLIRIGRLNDVYNQK